MKKHIFYCPNCNKEEMREPKRQWCDCANPPYEMAWHSKKEDEQQTKIISSYFSALGRKGGSATGKSKVRGDSEYYRNIRNK